MRALASSVSVRQPEVGIALQAQRQHLSFGVPGSCQSVVYRRARRGR